MLLRNVPPSAWPAVALSLALALSACAPRTPLSPENRRALRSVSVVKRSQYPQPKEVFIYTFGQNMAGAVAGGIGAALAHGATADERVTFRAKLEEGRVDPGLIVASEFEKKLAASRLLPLGHPPADAEFRFQTRIVGLGIPHGFATRLKPTLGAEGRLVRNDGTVIWKRYAAVAPARGEYRGADWDDYMANPEVLRAAFTQAAQLLADDFIVDLGGESAEDAEDRRRDEEEKARENEEDRRDQAAREARAKAKAERRAR